jgi:hypothetical protein
MAELLKRTIARADGLSSWLKKHLYKAPAIPNKIVAVASSRYPHVLFGMGRTAYFLQDEIQSKPSSFTIEPKRFSLVPAVDSFKLMVKTGLSLYSCKQISARQAVPASPS